MTERSFEIKDAHGDGRLVFRGTVPRGLTGYDGCNFVVSLISSALTATVDVYDIQPQQWTQFFADIATN